MEYHVELVERPAQPTLAVRTRTAVEDLPQAVGQAYGAVMAYAGQLGIWPAGAPFVAYHNMDMADLDMEIGFPFAERQAGQGAVLAGEIPGGKAAACLHVGPYDQLGAAYGALNEWMEAHEYAPTGVVYEFYLNDPETTPPAELQTQVVFPLK